MLQVDLQQPVEFRTFGTTWRFQVSAVKNRSIKMEFRTLATEDGTSSTRRVITARVSSTIGVARNNDILETDVSTKNETVANEGSLETRSHKRYAIRE